MREVKQPQFDRNGDPNYLDVMTIGGAQTPRRPQDGPPMSDATRALHEAVLRAVKGIVKAYEEWLSRQ
jgi:hypothetical protein